MKNLKFHATRIVNYSAILAITLSTIMAAPLLSKSRPQPVSIEVANNSSRDIIHLYLSPPGRENWGPDQLNDAILANGQSVTLSNVSCTEANIRIIGEDADGCFVSTIVACGDNTAWTITSDSPRDCGN
jgi:hypothetical protein